MQGGSGVRVSLAPFFEAQSMTGLFSVWTLLLMVSGRLFSVLVRIRCANVLAASYGVRRGFSADQSEGITAAPPNESLGYKPRIQQRLRRLKWVPYASPEDPFTIFTAPLFPPPSTVVF